jgi:hypothetical protein
MGIGFGFPLGMGLGIVQKNEVSFPSTKKCISGGRFFMSRNSSSRRTISSELFIKRTRLPEVVTQTTGLRELDRSANKTPSEKQSRGCFMQKVFNFVIIINGYNIRIYSVGG